MSSVSTTAASRLRKDYLRLNRDPVPYVTAVPSQSNILEWHYVIEGPSDSLYSGGYYHGKLVFPPDYPFKPPAIYMITPNGRFQINTRLCLSISDYHPDTWNPAWSVATILTGLLSFMRLKKKIEDEKLYIEQTRRTNGPNAGIPSTDGSAQNGANHVNNSTWSNILVFAGLVAFVFVARYVFQSAANDSLN